MMTMVEVALREGPGNEFKSIAVVPCGELIECSTIMEGPWVKATL